MALRILLPGLKLRNCSCNRVFTSTRLWYSDDSTDESETTTTKKSPSDDDQIKREILELSMCHVPQHGWSRAALSAGAESKGLPGVAHGLFPRGGIELVEHFYTSSNLKLADLMEKSKLITDPPESTKVFMTRAIEQRLRMIHPYIDKWPEAMALMVLPQNIPTALANLLTLVDDICYYSGDKSVDLTWYGKRVALAGIYKSTELYMLQDKTNDYIATWQFLSRRMDEAQQLHNVFIQTEQASQFAQGFASATFIVARNILGLNWNR